jgi:hypothetical protein
MPHDKNDHPLAEGDIVNVQYEIQRVYETDSGACNVTLKTVHARKHDQNHDTVTTASSHCEYVSSPVPEPIAHPHTAETIEEQEPPLASEEEQE